MEARETRLGKIKENNEISVLIIGAGINGIGTFRDLALQGVDVVMVDRADYCSGASAASSHMVHGGIRYLENGEFKLVREAVQERNRLIENAPHLVKPLATTFPIFKMFSGLLNAPLKFLGLLEKPSERGAVVLKLGMMLYDYYTRKQKTVPRHVFLDQKKSLAKFPRLNSKVRFTGTYYDGAMPSPERIAFELIEDAIAANPRAIPLNYVSLIAAKGSTVQLRDEINGEAFVVRPKLIVNASGPWIDLVNQDMGQSTHFISGTKGSHLILDNAQLRQAIGENEFFFENKDGRIVLIFPLFDKVMIGTSDLRVDHPDDVVITNEEVSYFFEMVQRVFPDIELNHSQIIYTFSGVRPLQHTERGNTGQISRNHKVMICEAGERMDVPILSLVGGKWTSFRAFSEHATDIILDRINVKRKVSTGQLAIGGSKDLPNSQFEKESYVSRLAAAYHVDAERVAYLLSRYGTRVETLLQAQGQAVENLLKSLPDISVGEIYFSAEQGDVHHLDDLLLRRTMMGKLGGITPESLHEVAGICARVFAWSEQKTSAEIDRFVELLRRRHKMNYNQYLGEDPK